MDPTTVLTMTQTISTTNVLSGTLGISTVAVYLAVDAVRMFGGMLGLLLSLTLFLFANKFQQWALMLALIAVLVWLPLSLTGLSLIGAAVVMFFILICAVIRAVGTLFWK